MRKIADSSKTACSVWFSARADGQVAAERLLDDQPRALGAARLAQPLDHRREHAGRDGQVVRGMRRRRRAR